MKVSTDKIITSYIGAVTKVPFTYGNHEIQPKPLIITPSLAGQSVCNCCGACCFKLTLDYLPTEAYPDSVSERIVVFNGKQFTILTDTQKDNDDHVCKYINVDALCEIHNRRPLSCDFELIRHCSNNTLTNRRYGRPFFMVQYAARKLDYYEMRYGTSHSNVKKRRLAKFTKPEYQPLCKISSPNYEGAADSIRKLRRLEQWAAYFGIHETWIPDVISYLEEGGWRFGKAVFS